MTRFEIIRAIMLAVAFRTVVANKPTGGEISAVSTNCSADSTPCGPGPSCCTSGHFCNYRRGIPICESPTENQISGFDRTPCADPYLFRCDLELGISGFCCPIGTSCFNDGMDNIIQCIDAYGTTASSIPSATTGLVPSSTPIVGSDKSIVYSPPEAWTLSEGDFECTSGKSLHVTNTVNSTISFNYAGKSGRPSIMIHTATSPNGGTFSVIVDGFNTTSTIDTFSGPGNESLPFCYPLQFPPFIATPPGYQLQQNHNVMLVFLGPSLDTPQGATPSSVGQFDAFAIPDPTVPLEPAKNGDSRKITNVYYIPRLFLSVMFSIYTML